MPSKVLNACMDYLFVIARLIGLILNFWNVVCRAVGAAEKVLDGLNDAFGRMAVTGHSEFGK
jgi:hypothetical protein